MTVRKPPPVLSPQAQWVDENGRPTKEFFALIAALLAWAKEVDTELG
jgi:hypothetical protein